MWELEQSLSNGDLWNVSRLKLSRLLRESRKKIDGDEEVSERQQRVDWFGQIRRKVSLSFAFKGKFDSAFLPQDPIIPCGHDDVTIVEGERNLMDSNRLTTAARVSGPEYLYFEHEGEKRGEASHEWHITSRHGNTETQLTGLSWADKVFMPGRVSDSSFVNQVWEPGGEQAHWDWLVRFYGCDMMIMLRIFQEIEFQAITPTVKKTQVLSQDRWCCCEMQELSCSQESGVDFEAWNELGVYICGGEKALMMFANNGLEIIQGYRVLKLGLHIFRRKLLIMMQKLFVSTIVSIHLEDKVSFSGGSKGMVRELGNDTMKKKLRCFLGGTSIIRLRFIELEEWCLKHSEVKRDVQTLSFEKGWTLANMVLPHVFVIGTGDKRPFDPGGANCVYELNRVGRLIEKLHGICLMAKTYSPMWQDGHQKPQYTKIKIKEKNIKNIKPRIIENDADKEEFQSFIHRLVKRFKVFKTMLVNRVVIMKEPRTDILANHLAEFLTNGVFRLLRPPEVCEEVFGLWRPTSLLMHDWKNRRITRGRIYDSRYERVKRGLCRSLQLEDKLVLQKGSIDTNRNVLSGPLWASSLGHQLSPYYLVSCLYLALPSSL
ncbi:unnamed protein product [Arabidopsis halleri]